MPVLDIQREEHLESDDRIDQFEKALVENGDSFEMPLLHNFIPGMYIRTIYMPKGIDKVNFVTTLIHNSEHLFHVSKGKVMVQVNLDKWEEIEAPYWGKTIPGTRRVLMILETCVWSTFHVISDEEQPVDNSDAAVQSAVNKIVERITIPHFNKHVGGVLKNNVIHNTIENENIFY